jgi:hypothetical protein
VKLTRQERKQVFDGSLKVLRRPSKPDQEAGTQIVVSQTRGGKQIVDRSTGACVDIPRQPRLWITIKGWHLRQGETEWSTDIAIHDRREQNRQLAAGSLGGIPRQPGLKTRWAETVDAEGIVRPRRVPSKAEQHENWTTETERGYGGGGRKGLDERCDFEEGMVVPAPGVDDETLMEFAARVADESNRSRERFRRAPNVQAIRSREKVRREAERGNKSGANAAQRRAGRAERRLPVAA